MQTGRKRHTCLVASITLIFMASCYYVPDPPPDACADVECAEGEQCLDGACVADQAGGACTIDEDCAGDLLCINGLCAPNESQPECTVDEDCAEGSVCLEGTCDPKQEAACTADDDCAADQMCQDDLCVDLANPECESDTDCEDGQSCVDGACGTGTEVLNAMETANPGVVFDALVVGETYQLTAPVATQAEEEPGQEEQTADDGAEAGGEAEDDAAIQTSGLVDECTCVWSVDPPDVASFDVQGECDVQVTVAQPGESSILVYVICGSDQVSSHTQSITAADPIVACDDTDDCAPDEYCLNLVCVDRVGPVVELLTDQSRPPYIASLDLRLEDQGGSPIWSGVTTDHFRLFEDGVEIDYDETGFFVTPLPDLPHKIVIVLDYTRSMESADAIDDMITAAKIFVAGGPFTETDSIGIVEFHDRTDQGSGFSTVVPLTPADAQGEQLIINGVPLASDLEAGLSRAWDAVQLAIDMLIANDRQPGEVRSIVFLTDGRDTTSEADTESLKSTALSERINLYPIGFGNAAEARQTLESLATDTGGSYFPATDGGEVRQAFEDLASDLRGEWNLRYITPANDGTVGLHIEFDWNGATSVLDHDLGAGELKGDIHQGVVQILSPEYDAHSNRTEFVLQADFIPRNVQQLRFAFAQSDTTFELSGNGGLASADNGWTLLTTGDSQFDLHGGTPFAFGSFGTIGNATVPGEVTKLQVIHDDTVLDGLAQPKTIVFSGEAWLMPLMLTTLVDPVEAGVVARSPRKLAYAHGESVVLTAVPLGNYAFQKWSGAITGTDKVVTKVLDNDAEVTAVFYPPRILTVSVEPAGMGTVVVEPNQSNYRHGDVVTLTAAVIGTATFKGWTGDASGTDPSIQVTMTGDKTITATFE